MYLMIATKNKAVVVLQCTTQASAEIAASVYIRSGYTVEVKQK